MNHLLAITKKELRGYFLSPVALIFLGTFLFATLLSVFMVEQFFARNVADVRPLFAWLPVMLIFLAAAVTMRLWSEEQKLGTLEVLLTLPVQTHHLVLGKFFAALLLVAVALGLTLGFPITVSMLGDLDLGPVVGGYVGALLLAGAYLAIGLCISALTDNQVVALISSAVVCGLFYIVGADWVTSNVGNRGAEILAAIGTGSRFESVRRGVLDLRDLVYYLSIIVTFLALNTVILKSKGWSDGNRSAGERRNWSLLVALVGANALVANILLSAFSVRADLTERGEYSISKVTKDLARGLEEPILIRGYFSEKTHPLLAPMVPRIRDMIEEYGEVSKGKVVTEFVDPREDEDLEKEANQLYGIKSFPFKVADRLDQAVVNSYFSILVKYGDQFEVLSFNDLIEVQATGMDNIEVKLRNLEYDLTRAMKKVAFGFQTVDALFAGLTEPAEVFAYITPKTLPENFKTFPDTVKKVLDEMSAEAKGKLKYQVIDPDAPGATENRDFLFKRYGFRPFAASLLSEETFYLHVLLKVGDQYERILPPESGSEADFKRDLTAAIKRAAPGFLKVVGLVKPPKAEQPELPPQFRQQQPPEMPDITQVVQKQLGESYTVEAVDLKSGRVPSSVDVLLVFGPENLDDKQQFAIDQHLMRGGTVIVLASKYALDPHAGQSVHVKQINTGLEALLASYGVTLDDAMVLDPQNEPIPMPVEREIRGMRIREIAYLPYPYFVNVRPENMSDDSPVVGGIPAITLPWASPLVVNLPEPKEGEPGRKADVLLSSTADAWTQSDTKVQPDFAQHGESGFPAPPAVRKSYPLAVAVSGSFDSFFKGKKDPTSEGAATIIERSPDTARLVVVGTSSFVNDMVLQLTRQAASNLQLVQNLVDWGVEDTDLLSIRSRGTFARTLVPLEPRQRLTYELVNYGLVIFALIIIGVVGASRRRAMTPLDLGPAPGAVGTPAEAKS